MLSSLYESLTMLSENKVVVRIIVSIIILLVGLVILVMIKGIFKKLESRRVTERAALENMYKIIYGSLVLTLLFIVIYVLTQQQIIVVFLLGVILILLASSWEVIANLAGYYALLASRNISRGDYVIIPPDMEGRVREITPLFTIIDGDKAVYSVPNLTVLRKGIVSLRDPITVYLIVRVWGFEDPDALASLKEVIEEKVTATARNVLASPEKARGAIEELSVDGATIRIPLKVPGPRPNTLKISELIEELAVALKDTGYSFNINFEYN
jgi:small-conductance mechanosensitive channel